MNAQIEALRELERVFRLLAEYRGPAWWFGNAPEAPANAKAIDHFNREWKASAVAARDAVLKSGYPAPDHWLRFDIYELRIKGAGGFLDLGRLKLDHPDPIGVNGLISEIELVRLRLEHDGVPDPRIKPPMMAPSADSNLSVADKALEAIRNAYPRHITSKDIGRLIGKTGGQVRGALSNWARSREIRELPYETGPVGKQSGYLWKNNAQA